MTDRPIIFSAPMIKALLAGRKTQTRRIVKGVPMLTPEYDERWNPHVIPPAGSMPDQWSWWEGPSHGPSMYHSAKIRYAAGDRLYVRENHALVPTSAYRMSEGVVQTVNPADRHEAAIYAAGWDRSKPKWRPSIHMPRWASRLTLLVTDVRVQRLQDISEEDAAAEGARSAFGEWFDAGVFEVPADGVPRRTLFAGLWSQIHGDGSWSANPWVVAVSFTVQHGNIDALPVAVWPAPPPASPSEIPNSPFLHPKRNPPSCPCASADVRHSLIGIAVLSVGRLSRDGSSDRYVFDRGRTGRA